MLPFTTSNPLPQDLSQDPSMTRTAQDVVAQANQPKTDQPTVSPEDAKRFKEFKQRIDQCKLYRRKLVVNWTVSIDYRRGKPFASQTDEDTIAVNLDWSMTKAKQASLFSQVPKVRVDIPQVQPWMTAFESRLNNQLVLAGIESAMDESLPDCINAAGFGAVLVSYEALTDTASIPTADPLATQSNPGTTPETTPIARILDHRYLTERISPADFLWPIGFTAANFDKAPWLGRSGRITWANAMNRFNLTEADKETVLGEDRTTLDRLSHDIEKDKSTVDDMVGFDEIFYKEFEYNPSAVDYTTIHHLVFVSGKDEPVIDEPWKGQKQIPDPSNPQATIMVGAIRLPIRVLTLAYITDETIPPSDSAIGRPQVNEINKSRTQQIRQRERSLPVRWFDVNRVDSAIQQGLMRGTWQNMIPVQGDGSRVIGEVARASMPQENFAFDKIAKSDLSEAWTVGPNQEGSGAGVDTAAEANAIQSNFQTRVGRERARVASFFVGIAEVLGGLMCIYEDPNLFGQGFDQRISKALSYSILADSTVLVDANQKLQKLNQFVNMYGKSGLVDLPTVMKEIAALSGLDPKVIIPPMPRPPVEPNISLRLTGVEDLLNPLSLAFLIKSGQAPPPPMIEQAKQLIQQAVVPPQGMQMPGQVQPLGGMPMLPQGAAPAGPPPPGAPLPPPSGAPPPGSPTPPPPPAKVGEAHPNLAILPHINTRSET